MKLLVLGAHLRREEIEPLAEALPAGPLFLSAIAVADDQPIGDRDLLLRAAGVRSKLVDRATFVAIRYGFTAASAEEAARKCGDRIEAWRRLLEEHRDEIEMTLKVAAASREARPRRGDFDTGAAYLRALHGAMRNAAVDPAFRTAVDETIGRAASAVRWLHRDEASVEMAALVKRSRLAELQREGESLKERFPNVPFLLSGPWPLEVFADAGLE